MRAVASHHHSPSSRSARLCGYVTRVVCRFSSSVLQFFLPQKSTFFQQDSSDQERRRLDQLLAENKRLEKQKNELMTGFKKQMKLIDILKKTEGESEGTCCHSISTCGDG